ncbi:MAG: DUF898 family protein [Acidobacteria bacterium]|nr:DUF898 family protein [Acidobacteriota bacterium]
MPQRAQLLVLALVALCSAASLPASGDLSKLDAFRRRAQLRLGEAALAAHDVDDAQRRLEEALKLAREADDAPELARIQQSLGDVYRRRNQLGGARAFYMRALQLAPNAEAKRDALGKLASLAMQRSRWSDAADWLEQALAVEPQVADWLRLGETRLHLGRESEAKEAFERALELAESHTRADVEESIARRYAWTGDADAAALHRSSALALRRDDPDAYLRALRDQALGADAEQSLAALAVDPRGAAWAHRIRALELAPRDLERAIVEQRAVVEVLREQQAPELAQALEELARLEERRAQDAPAAELRKEALALRGLPDSPAALSALEALASNLERSGAAGDAETLWEEQIEALQTAHGDRSLAVASACERFADLLMRQKRYEEAATQLGKASQIRRRIWGSTDGGRQRTLERLADVLRRAGRESDAQRAESQLAFLSISKPATREAPRGRRDTGTWLSESPGLAFVGLALCMATVGMAWAGWTTFTRLQPGLEEGFRPAPMRIAEAPAWTPVKRTQSVYPVVFRGRGGALFGIWSVNMALTLLTLGLYFFWGKVRVRRYFWGQAELAGDRFSFHGTGRELLFGWLKAAPVLALVLWGPGLLDLAWENPDAGLYGAGVALTFLGLLWPLAEIGASRYRLSRTSWRAIRFSFRGEAWPYMKLWLGGTLLWIVTLGLWGPFFDAARRRYMVNHMRFGDARFQCDIHGRDLFPFYLTAWVLLLPTVGASYLWYKALAERYYWSRTQLVHSDEITRTTFECSLKGIDLLVLWIQTWGTLALTLGLGWPWTRIWEARLRLQTLTMTGDFRPGRIRQSTDAAGAAGEGAADFLGLDFGFFA